MGEISRRSVLRLGAVAAGTAILAGPLGQLVPAVAGAATRATAASLTERLPVGRWKALVGSTFTVVSSRGVRSRLQLRSATELKKDPLLSGSGYILVFRGGRRPLVPMTRSVLTHRSIGSVRATLLPISKPAVHQSYQVIIDERRPVRSVRR